MLKKLKLALIICFIILVSSCEGSDSFQGKWKALNLKGEKYEITFSPKEIAIKDSLGKSIKHSYVQSGAGHHGSSDMSIDTYKILLDNGQNYKIHFPKNNESIGLILMVINENESLMFTISRKNYLTYEDINKLN
ncbi:hypothetical protein [Flavobacterium sp. FlaQc-50]|uniref:hypothetical protein n=1 Tax=unclassified Flavobacterium TaxID=196869 RepID=UPI00375748BE